MTPQSSSLSPQSSVFDKHPDCLDDAHECRKVSDGMVCQERCEWLRDYPLPKIQVNQFPENEGT